MKLFMVKIASMVACLTTMLWVTTAAALAQPGAKDEFSNDSSEGVKTAWINPDGRAGHVSYRRRRKVTLVRYRHVCRKPR